MKRTMAAIAMAVASAFSVQVWADAASKPATTVQITALRESMQDRLKDADSAQYH